MSNEPKLVRADPPIGDVLYKCGNCRGFSLVVREEDSMESKKAEMKEHSKICRRVESPRGRLDDPERGIVEESVARNAR